MEKLDKAIMQSLLIFSEVCAGLNIAEDKILELINHTKTVITEVQRPGVSEGLSKSQLMQLEKHKTEFDRLITSPALIYAGTDEEKETLRRLNESYHSVTNHPLANSKRDLDN
jgi:hypothetical protein